MAYKLTYFDFAARGEPARLIFAAANVKFVDNRVKMQDWPALKPTLEWGQMPVLQFGDKTLTQSKAIYRYLGRKFKLSGADEWESAQCDELVDAISDLVDEFVKFAIKEQDPVKKEELKRPLSHPLFLRF
ncbi:Glutathione S-transferase 1 [Orchesella cincta]|uniref:glutathione transferase n=1 Tax=Orchesella cincta TaxID=48709 RepID=A0A1D2M6Z2_ORCCI|nr:Glutathione S-transferase 1 [Orchesella cincta]